MKRSLYLIIVLFATAVHGAAPPGDGPALQEELRAVQRLMVASGIPEKDAAVTLQAMVRARFTVEQIIRVGRQFGQVGQQPASAQAIQAKIHEGIAKKIPPETVLAATIRVRSRNEFAAKLATEIAGTNRPELAAIYADCLAAGLTEKGARQLTAALRASGKNANSPGELAAETLLTARDMVRQNISSPTTVDLLEKALRQGYRQEEIRSLRHSLAGMQGELARNAQRIGAAIDQGVRAGDLPGSRGGAPGGRSSNSSEGGERGSGPSGGRGNETDGRSGGDGDHEGGGESQGSSGGGGRGGADGSSGGGGGQGGGRGGSGNN